MGAVEAFAMLGVSVYIMISVLISCGLMVLSLFVSKTIADVIWYGLAFLQKHATVPLDILF